MKIKLFIAICILFSSITQAQMGIRSKELKSLLKQNQPYILRTGLKDVKLDKYNYEEFGSDFLLENLPESSDSLSFSIVNREGEVSGFIYYPNADQSILIKTVKGKVVYEETKSSEIMVSCSFTKEEEEHNHQAVAQESVFPDTYFIGNYATETDVLKLQSKPGAKYLLYLDFDGEPTLKGWESQGFVATAVNNIPVGLKQRIWESVAADFIAFDVNVTNDRALFDAHSTTRKGWAVCADFGSPGWYGVAYRPSFGTGKPALIDLPTSWNGNYNYLFRTPSHELGHSLSLNHDGNNLNGDGEYYKGHGEYTPIMGSGTRLVTHWSKGEYSGATNTEDDISIIHGYLGYASDDNASTREITFSGEDVNSIDNNGVIENRQDIDVWSFEMTGTGDVSLTVDPVLALSDFDVHIELQDEWGQVVAESNPEGTRKATIAEALDRGMYYLHVYSGHEKTSNTGWSNYGVFGYYDIYGNVENVVREQVDIIAIQVKNLKNVCSTSEVIVPEIELLNGGAQDLTSVKVEVYEDDVLQYSQTEYFNLLSDDVINIPLQAIQNDGTHNYQVKLIDPTGLESKTDNNIATGDFSFINGKEYQFYTDMPFYDGESGFQWEITSSTLNEEISNSTDFAVGTSDNFVTQEICLKTNNCYAFVFSGEIDNCVGSDRWDANEIYLAGDQCTYGGFSWQAKWWTQNEEPPAGVWEKVGSCASATYSFGVNNTSDQSNVFELLTSDYVNPTSEEFCDGAITGEREFDEVDFSVYPNPFNTQLNINVDQVGKLHLFNVLGEKIWQKDIQGKSSFDVSFLDKGMYIAVFENKNGKQSIALVK